jgi:hypothetical protein
VTPASANGHFDLQAAAKAAATEAAQRPIAFTYKAEEYEIPPGRDWPVGAVVAVAAGQLAAALPELLGADAYAKLIGAGLTAGELDFLVRVVTKEAGFDLPADFPLPALPSSTPT